VICVYVLEWGHNSLPPCDQPLNLLQRDRTNLRRRRCS